MIFDEEWKIIEDYPNYEVSSFGRVINSRTGRILNSEHLYVAVRVRETGEIYPNQLSCARALGIHQGGITSVLSGRAKTAGGYSFERVIGDAS